MTEGIRARLEGIGVDLETTLNRFAGMESMFMRFLCQFPDDQSYQALCGAVEARDGEAAFRAAHTLKGVAGNLGLENIYGFASELTELLRGGDAGQVLSSPAFLRLWEETKQTY